MFLFSLLSKISFLFVIFFISSWGMEDSNSDTKNSPYLFKNLPLIKSESSNTSISTTDIGTGNPTKKETYFQEKQAVFSFLSPENHRLLEIFSNIGITPTLEKAEHYINFFARDDKSKTSLLDKAIKVLENNKHFNLPIEELKNRLDSLKLEICKPLEPSKTDKILLSINVSIVETVQTMCLRLLHYDKIKKNIPKESIEEAKKTYDKLKDAEKNNPANYGKLLRTVTDPQYHNDDCEFQALLGFYWNKKIKKLETFDNLPEKDQVSFTLRLLHSYEEVCDKFQIAYHDIPSPLLTKFSSKQRRLFGEFIADETTDFIEKKIRKRKLPETPEFLMKPYKHIMNSHLKRFSGILFVDLLFNYDHKPYLTCISDIHLKVVSGETPKADSLEESKKNSDPVLKGDYHALYFFNITKAKCKYIGDLETIPTNLDSETCIYFDGYSLKALEPSRKFSGVFQCLNEAKNMNERREIFSKNAEEIFRISFFDTDINHAKIDPLMKNKCEKEISLRKDNLPEDYNESLIEKIEKGKYQYNTKEDIPFGIRHVYLYNIAGIRKQQQREEEFNKITAQVSDILKE